MASRKTEPCKAWGEFEDREFLRICEDYRPSLVNLASRDVISRAYSDDFAARAIEKAWRRRQHIVLDVKAIRGYLRRIMFNLVADAIRRKKVINHLSLDAPLSQATDDHTTFVETIPGLVHDGGYGEIDAAEIFELCVSQSDKETEYAVRRVLEGLTTEEIARELGLPESNIKARLLRFRNRNLAEFGHLWGLAEEKSPFLEPSEE